MSTFKHVAKIAQIAILADFPECMRHHTKTALLLSSGRSPAMTKLAHHQMRAHPVISCSFMHSLLFCNVRVIVNPCFSAMHASLSIPCMLSAVLDVSGMQNVSHLSASPGILSSVMGVLNKLSFELILVAGVSISWAEAIMGTANKLQTEIIKH